MDVLNEVYKYYGVHGMVIVVPNEVPKSMECMEHRGCILNPWEINHMVTWIKELQHNQINFGNVIPIFWDN
jgi:hypothetical protein